MYLYSDINISTVTNMSTEFTTTIPICVSIKIIIINILELAVNTNIFSTIKILSTQLIFT